MSLLGIIITIVIVGVVMWLINTYIPMQHTVKVILNVLVVIILLLWLLRVLGAGDYFSGIRAGQNAAISTWICCAHRTAASEIL